MATSSTNSNANSSTDGSFARALTSTSTGRLFGIWVPTGFFSALFAFSGVMFLVGPPEIVTNFRHLGYPDYFRQLLGVAKR